MKFSFALLALGLLASPVEAEDDTDDPYRSCTKSAQTVALSSRPEQTLSFQIYGCKAAGGATASFQLDSSNTLIMRWDDDPATSQPVAQFWPLRGRAPADLIGELAEPSIRPEEKGRCQVQADALAHHFAYTPDPAFLKDLLAAGEPFAACGTYGDSNDSVQYWTVIGNVVLAYLWVGQDTPMFDPESFTYVNTKTPGVVE